MPITSLSSFNKTNIDLWEDYGRIMTGNDEEKKKVIEDDYKLLKSIHSSSLVGNHYETKFHCLSLSFRRERYHEKEWEARLYYSIKDKLPDHVSVLPAYKYSQQFNPFQQTFSDCAKDNLYFFMQCQTLYSSSVEKIHQLV